MSRIDGIDRLIAVRKSGHKPAIPVWLWIGYPKSRFSGDAIDLSLMAPSRSADIRPFVGLDVIVCADRYSPQLFEFLETMKTVSSSIVMWIQEWSEDVDSMIVWDRRNGQRTLGELKK